MSTYLVISSPLISTIGFFTCILALPAAEGWHCWHAKGRASALTKSFLPLDVNSLPIEAYAAALMREVLAFTKVRVWLEELKSDLGGPAYTLKAPTSLSLLDGSLPHLPYHALG